jgi:hypothetical protein
MEISKIRGLAAGRRAGTGEAVAPVLFCQPRLGKVGGGRVRREESFSVL